MSNCDDLRDAFLSHALAHHEASLAADYRKANKLHNELMHIYKEVLAQDRSEIFAGFIDHENESVRIWACTFLLPTNTARAVQVLANIRDSESPVSTIAGTVIELWTRGQLNL